MVGVPLVWKTIEKQRGGKVFKIKIQQITPEYVEPVVELMTKHFAAREPMTSYIKLLSDPVSTNDLQTLWRETLKDGCGLVAVLDGDESTIVGANVTGIATKDAAPEIGQGEIFNKVLEVLMMVSKEGDIFNRYGVDKYLTAMGLTVHPDYHGLDLGLEILKCRENVCKFLDIKVSATIFTAGASQHIARKAGFETLVEHDYKDIVCNGRATFKDLPGKLSNMSIVYS